MKIIKQTPCEKLEQENATIRDMICDLTIWAGDRLDAAGVPMNWLNDDNPIKRARKMLGWE
jgi:hypothetical protein